MSDEVEVIAPEPTPEPVEAPEIETEAIKEEEVPQPEEKKFTQTEINTIIQKEKAKAAAIAERRALKVYAEKLEKMTTQPVKQEAPQDGKPRIEHYGNDVEAYVEAVSDWKLAQRDQESQKASNEISQRQMDSKTAKMYAEASTLDQSFDRESFDEILTPAIAQAIIGSDISAKLMVHLAANPGEAEKISRLSPVRQAAEIGKLEVTLSNAKPVKVSNAPAPIEPVGSRGSSSKDPSQMSDKEFAVWRKSQIVQRR